MMLLPTELSLRTTKDGVRLFSKPIKEFEQLQTKVNQWNSLTADKANDLPRRLVRELAHGERLQKSCFNLFHAVMVAVENFLRAVEVQALLGARVPRQLKARFEVHTHDGALMRAVRHFGEAIALF